MHGTRARRRGGNMDKLLAEVKAAVQAEYNRAAEVNGATFHSQHEAYAIILEEVEEAEHEARKAMERLTRYWLSIKANGESNRELPYIQQRAERAAAEWIQVAAMCHKAMQSKTEVSETHHDTAQPTHERDDYSTDFRED